MYKRALERRSNWPCRSKYRRPSIEECGATTLECKPASNGVGEKFGGKRREFLAIVVVESKIQTNAVEADSNAVVGIVAERDSYREHADGVGSFFWKGGFVAFGGKPGIGGDGEAVVRVQ